MKTTFSFLYIIFLASVTVSLAQSPLKFDLGAGKHGAGRTRVQATDVYSKEKGYGFEPGADIVCSARGGKAGSGYCASNKPFYFSAAVPEGNYKVTINFGSKTDASMTTVKAELRRLMLEKVETQKGKFATESFIVNVHTPLIAGGGDVKLIDRERTTEWLAWAEILTLEFNNSHL